MTNEEMTKATSELEAFLESASHEFGFSPPEIKAILGKQFKGFSKRQISDYRLLLSEMRTKRILEEEQSYLEEKTKPVPYPPCPRCGAPTIGDLSLFGKHTKEQGWLCSKAGRRHFLEHKANQMLRRQGKAPIYPEITGESGDGVDYELLWQIAGELENEGIPSRDSYPILRGILLGQKPLPENNEELYQLILKYKEKATNKS